jgi:hypothetical protein
MIPPNWHDRLVPARLHFTAKAGRGEREIGRGRIWLRRIEALLEWAEKHPTGAKQAAEKGLKLTRNKNASSTKRDVVMKFYGLPPIGQKQRRPMDGAQFHSPRVGEAGGRLKSIPQGLKPYSFHCTYTGDKSPAYRPEEFFRSL